MPFFLDDRPVERRQGRLPAPPPERRCQAWRRGVRNSSGERVKCSRWSMRGRPYCQYHWRRHTKNGLQYLSSASNVEHAPQMPAAYGHFLSESLKQRLAALAGDTPAEVIVLTEELKLAKSTIHDVSEFYDLALLASEQSVHGEPKQQQAALMARLQAGQMLRGVITEVADIAAQAASSLAASKAFVGVADIPLLVSQMVEVVHAELGDSQEAVETVMRIAEKMREIRMPSSGAQGTDLTPDLDVAAMDATVPRIAQDTREEEDAA